MNPWRSASLIELADYINGYAFKPEDHVEDGLPIIRIEQLKNPNAVFDYYDKTVPDNNYIENGDLIFSWSASLYLEIWNRGKAILNQHLFKVVPKPDIDKLFLKYCIDFHLPGLVNASHGSTMKHITRRELKRFQLDIPEDKNEQCAIAKVLATLDIVIKQTEALIAKYQRIKVGLMQDLLTRGIDEHGQLRHPSTHRFKPSPLGMIPEEWEITNIAKESTRITSGSRWWAKYYTESGALFVRIGNLTREHVNLRFDDVQYVKAPSGSESTRTRLESGDLLISITADLGIIGVVPHDLGEAYINQHIALVKLNQNEVNSWWVGNYLAGPITQKIITMLNESGAKAGLNLPTIASLQFPKPKYKEQLKIAGIIQEIDQTVAIEKDRLNKYQKLKIGLMHDLLTGELSVAPLLEKEKSGMGNDHLK